MASYSLSARIDWQMELDGGALAISGFTGTAAVHAKERFPHLGRVYPSNASQARITNNGQRSCKGSVTVQVDLSPAQMAAIEDARNGGDILFLVTLDIELCDLEDK